LLPVSAFPVDGTWPTGTTKWEKRNIALEIPVWDQAICIQCNKCSMVCPHATIRPTVFDPALAAKAPEGFRMADYKAPDFKGMKFSMQVAPEDCTGCALCISVCPVKDKANPKHRAINMEPKLPILEREKANWAFFETLPKVDRSKIARVDVKSSQLFEPLFEYSGACSGCGETQYVKLLTQLFGDRSLIANATGCSSIYGGNLPTTPYTTNKDGRGPAWNNSLFEDNAEFGFGMRLAVDKHAEFATELLKTMASQVGDDLVASILAADQSSEAGIAAQRDRIATLKAKLAKITDAKAGQLALVADYLVRKSVWILGGDGWAYDIGFGGLDHVIAMNRDVNILVLDTEVYSNTGGQASKATPIGAAAKFAAAGKAIGKKDLGMIAMSYGHCYVASVAFGSKDAQTVQAFQEADSYPGVSIIIAYAHCIAHGYDLKFGLEQQKLAVDSGQWPLYRYDPRRAAAGESPLKLDSAAPKIPVSQYMQNETRFRMVEKIDPKRFAELALSAQAAATNRIAFYQQLAEVNVSKPAAVAGKDAAQ
jgi:pyruvate-ferredoxin/flavodoxin oxidoreductase